jgi:hypothetical protein
MKARQMDFIGWAAVVVILLSTGAQIASAYKPGACRQDAEKLCPGLKGKEQVRCLKVHQEELSMDCKVNIAEGRQMVRDVKDACAPDIKKHCAGIEIGGGRIRRCLKAHEAELSDPCKAQIAAVKEKYNPAAVSSGTK